MMFSVRQARKQSEVLNRKRKLIPMNLLLPKVYQTRSLVEYLITSVGLSTFDFLVDLKQKDQL
jgi:hypothetical protein